MKQSSFLGRLAIAILFALSVAACYTNPHTGRSELMLISPAEEAQLGFDAFNTIKQETPASQDPAQNDLVTRVGQKISSVVTLPHAQWEFVTFQDDQTANAFCLPGGKVGVYTGLLPITQSEPGLATVVGHEVAHAVARHGGERMSQSLLVQLGGVGLAVALREKPQQTQQLAMTAYGLGSTVGYVLPFSRKAESEADYMGLMFMARAGYDPREAVSFWQRFKSYTEQQGGQPPEFLIHAPAVQPPHQGSAKAHERSARRLPGDGWQLASGLRRANRALDSDYISDRSLSISVNPLVSGNAATVSWPRRSRSALPWTGWIHFHLEFDASPFSLLR